MPYGDTMINIKRYEFEIELTKKMLGTNPFNPNVMDTHIIDRQRKLIAEKSTINKAINKYLDAKDISVERQEIELKALRNRIEETMGASISDEEFELMRSDNFKKFADLKETLSELDEKGITCFFRNDEGRVCIGSHMILGFMKAAAEAICKTRATKKGTILQSASYTHSVINQHVDLEEELLEASEDIIRDENNRPLYLQRSLRAMTKEGPRISLAKSEQLPKGTRFKFILSVLQDSPIKKEHIEDMFSYGEIKGLGQWRNAGNGKFKVLNMKEL